MNKDEIILMADASGIAYYGMGKDRDKFLHYLEAFAALVAAAEREACAAMFDDRQEIEQEPVAFYHPRNGFYWAKPTSIFAPTVVDVPPMPLYAAAERNHG